MELQVRIRREVNYEAPLRQRELQSGKDRADLVVELASAILTRIFSIHQIATVPNSLIKTAVRAVDTNTPADLLQ
jgi:hypothetical protein